MDAQCRSKLATLSLLPAMSLVVPRREVSWGNLLFCITTNAFAELPSPRIYLESLTTSSSDSSLSSDDSSASLSSNMVSLAEVNNDSNMICSTPSTRGQFAYFRPPACLADLSGSFESDEEEDIRFFRNRNRLAFETTLSDPSSIEEFIIPDSSCHEPISCFVYIDDFNTVEKVRFTEAESHISTRKRTIKVCAKKSELQFENVRNLAEELNMKVNSKKTQVLCIHVNKTNIISSYINTNEGQIESTDKLKILGFKFGSEPNAILHVTGLIHKFNIKLWTLRFLRKSGMDSENLLKVYRTILLPSIEYCSEIYDSLIPEYLSAKLEQMQKRAMKIVFGWTVDYSALVEDGTIETLKSRRTRACLCFANRALANHRFGDRWFPRNRTEREARESTRRPYLERRARTERMKNNPIQHMIRLLNQQSSH